jgi:PTH1 family peptidyl-tRNA hydrolase
MKLIVGLGNPGTRYERTRHNIGFRVVEAFARKYRIDFDTHEKDALTGKGRVAGNSVLVAKPLTYMNLSGEPASKLIRAYLDSPAEMIVVYDDIDLPLGKLRVRERGSAGTHNGMRSIIAAISSENFPRLRFGIKGTTYDEVAKLRDYVLEDFDTDEEGLIETTTARAVEALLLFARGDLRRAMNQFNRDPQPPATEGAPAGA